MTGNLHRRTFLRAAGVSLALPLLETMNRAQAKEVAVAPRRMVLICTTLGLHAPALFPKTTGADYESTEYLDILQKHRSDFTLFSGLAHEDQVGRQGHSSEMTWLTAQRNPGLDGFQNAISVDQFAAGKLGYVTRFPSIVLSTNLASSQSYTQSGVMVPAEFNPARLFASMFLRGKPHETEQQKQKLSDGRSILDSLMEQTRTLKNRSSSADRRRLDDYFQSVRKAERDLAEAQAWLERPKPTVDAPAPTNLSDPTELIGRTQRLMNMIPLILQTDSSRVISLVIQDHHVVPKLDGVSLEHHNLSHHGQEKAKISQLKTIEKALLQCYNDLLNQLQSKQEGGISLLDNTTALFGSNLGNANAHDPQNLPILLAGGGYKHGRHVACNKKDKPLCNLFVSMLNNLGVETDSFAASTGKLTW